MQKVRLFALGVLSLGLATAGSFGAALAPFREALVLGLEGARAGEYWNAL